MTELSEEHRETIREANKRRAGHVCRKCGAGGCEKLDGGKIGGMPGIQYWVCNGCGWNRAITHRPRKEKLQ